jgi:CBS domain-containing protein
VQEQRLATPLSAYMSSPVVSVQFDSSLAEAADLLRTSHVRGLLVVDGEWPVGLFTQEEALLATDRSAATQVEEVMTSALLCLDAETPLFRVAAQALATRARRVVAVRNRDVVGILTGLDLARAVAQSQ